MFKTRSCDCCCRDSVSSFVLFLLLFLLLSLLLLLWTLVFTVRTESSATFCLGKKKGLCCAFASNPVVRCLILISRVFVLMVPMLVMFIIIIIILLFRFIFLFYDQQMRINCSKQSSSPPPLPHCPSLPSKHVLFDRDVHFYPWLNESFFLIFYKFAIQSFKFRVHLCEWNNFNPIKSTIRDSWLLRDFLLWKSIQTSN